MKKFTIWSSDINLDDWRDDLLEEYPDYSDEELYELACEMNDEYLEDDLVNLSNVLLEEDSLVIADLWLWYGRRSGYACFSCADVGDLIKRAYNGSGCEPTEIYVDELGDLSIKIAHHDGTNYLTLRTWKHSASARQRENLLDKLYEGTATPRDITRVTEHLGDKIARYYGIETGSRRYAIAKEKARQEAIQFQINCEFGVLYSWEDLANIGEHFRKLGKRYGLLREFRENAII